MMSGLLLSGLLLAGDLVPPAAGPTPPPLVPVPAEETVLEMHEPAPKAWVELRLSLLGGVTTIEKPFTNKGGGLMVPDARVAAGLAF